MPTQVRSQVEARGKSPFSRTNMAGRLLWGMVQSTLYQFSPRPMHQWRCFLLRLFGATVGRRVHPYPGSRFWAPWNTVVGNDVGIADGAVIYAMKKIVIGDRTTISQESYICGGTHDFTRADMPLVAKEVLIGSDCWLAARCFVHPGVRIGDGVVVGACSVVVKDLPGWSVCVGNPCKPLRGREYYD